MEEGEQTIEESIAIFRRTLPADHWRIANALSILGAIRARQGRFTEAEELLLSALPEVDQATGSTSPYTRVFIERLIDLYQRWGNDSAAQTYRQM